MLHSSSVSCGLLSRLHSVREQKLKHLTSSATIPWKHLETWYGFGVTVVRAISSALLFSSSIFAPQCEPGR